MPELSRYSPQPIDMEPLEDDFSDVDHYLGAGRAAKMRQDVIDSWGFADPRRSYPDVMLHGLMQNVPREQWDQKMFLETRPPGYGTSWTGGEDLTPPEFTIRQLMEALKNLAPNELQAP